LKAGSTGGAVRWLTTFPFTSCLFTYAYDPMERPVKLTDNSADPVEWVNNVAYNAAGQMTQMTRLTYIGDGGIPAHHSETRDYNARNQLTRLRVIGVLDHEYRFSATANDGRITQRKDWLSGEEVSYQYDSLNRLVSAMTTGPEWGQSFSYDGFGNLLNQTVTKGSAPSLAVNVDGNTNRIITGGYAYL
jgi:YD repeat-containing protein